MPHEDDPEMGSKEIMGKDKKLLLPDSYADGIIRIM
jgi:hypothetical protein